MSDIIWKWSKNNTKYKGKSNSIVSMKGMENILKSMQEENEVLILRSIIYYIINYNYVSLL